MCPGLFAGLTAEEKEKPHIDVALGRRATARIKETKPGARPTTIFFFELENPHFPFFFFLLNRGG